MAPPTKKTDKRRKGKRANPNFDKYPRKAKKEANNSKAQGSCFKDERSISFASCRIQPQKEQ
jgi:hypothetical protein